MSNDERYFDLLHEIGALIADKNINAIKQVKLLIEKAEKEIEKHK